MAERRTYYFYLVSYVSAVIVIYYISNGFSFVFSSLPAIQALVSGLGISYLVLEITERYLWKSAFVRNILGINIPYLEGRWEGHIKSSYSEYDEEHKIALEIFQTLNNVVIHYYDENAHSYSLMAGFASEHEGGPVKLYAIYRNVPHRSDYEGLNMHNGAMELTVRPQVEEISGVYYNNPRERDTYGQILVNYVGPQKFGGLQVKEDQND